MKLHSSTRRRLLDDTDFQRCIYCDKLLSAPEMTIDHVVPIAAGGTNKPLNLVVACYPCNNAKGSGSAESFWRKFHPGSRKKVKLPQMLARAIRDSE